MIESGRENKKNGRKWKKMEENERKKYERK